MASVLSYCVVTPVRDEAANVKRLAECLAAQTVLPDAWVIVDNGSSDGTVEVARDLASRHPWVKTADSDPERIAMPGAPIVRAFETGLEFVGRCDVVVKLDADVSFGDDYFEQLLDAFAEDDTLGIAGGVCNELRDGRWVPTHVTGAHVRGASRAYRAACLEQVRPLEPRLGWDSVDELKAGLRGWSTRSVPNLHFRHHRSVGERDGARTRRWIEQGRGAHFLGYRPLYLALRALRHAPRDPAALTMLWGYARTAIRNEARCEDDAVRGEVRRQQALSRLASRGRESVGRGQASAGR